MRFPRHPSAAILATIISVFLSALLSVSCSLQEEIPSEGNIRSSAVIIPQGSSQVPLFAPPADDSGTGETVVQSTPRVVLPQDLILHQVYDLALDRDDPDEQLISFKLREGQDDRIGILIADYDPIRNGYFISWQGLTQANSLKTFSVSSYDITGDRQIELVIIGTNNQGDQTLDIFKQTVGTAYGVQFTSILSIAADIEADVNIVERDDFYNSGERNGIPFTVSALNQDLESGNVLDMVRSVYTWRPGEQRYLLSFTERILGTNVEEEELAELFSGDLNDFHRFIDGPWLSLDGEKIILFSQGQESVQMATAGRQQNFIWLESNRFGFGSSIRINLRNENISHVMPRLAVSVTDLNTMRVTHSDEDPAFPFWSGDYRRILSRDRTSVDNPLASDQESIQLYPIDINGLYRSDNNQEMFFSAPFISMRTPAGEESGGYVLYTLNEQLILQINFIDQNGSRPRKAQYLVAFEELENETEIRRSLFLTAAEINSYGAAAVSDQIIRLEQIIQQEDQAD